VINIRIAIFDSNNQHWKPLFKIPSNFAKNIFLAKFEVIGKLEAILSPIFQKTSGSGPGLPSPTHTFGVMEGGIVHLKKLMP
jgi:hypothetical protein